MSYNFYGWNVKYLKTKKYKKLVLMLIYLEQHKHVNNLKYQANIF